MTQVAMYDTTLRDGTQGEGISLSVRDKLKIAQKLDDFGVRYIEGGWPGSNPKDAEFFARQAELNLKNAQIAAFGSTRHKNTTCDDDANIQALIEANTPVVTLVGKSWDLHVHHVLETDPEENLNMILESVEYFKARDKEVVYDAEHFFDGYKANPDYALLTLTAAAQGGADCLVLCDTNGGSTPWEVEEITRRVLEQFPETQIGIHAHNDCELGVANSLAAIRAGASHVQGTINGYGERVGNANLMSIIPGLQLKMGYSCVDHKQLVKLTALSRYVDELANMTPNTHQPFVGHSAFAHKGGIHVAAMLKIAESYQHMDPTLVGNEQRAVVSELSGRGNILYMAQELGLDTGRDEAKQVLDQIKELENQGYTFEGADASIDIMLRRAKEDYQPPFEVVDFMVITENRQRRGLFTEATVKVKVGDEVRHTVGEGNGPVNALNLALRKALHQDFPQLGNVHLSDYKVRILDSDSGTAAKTRVMIDFYEGGTHHSWTTVGAHTNIIEASWRALVDSMEYALLNGQRF
ncbi:MAG: citramalate synthase [Anaerolineae bacterium]|nr:citramalate synthase [Anaerolineae bacterium]MCB0178374.1 citramalate synthase [Anaerolineae bacterium]MCB0222469.1 citramalate synthase [Anaerolineae bacterium]MCB9108944.1 citramalate synthase [Anaerolineales bacterium]